MAKYVKKPVAIEAYQTDKEMIIRTLEGDMKASVGDYIITGVHGELYPCKPDIFEETYQPLADKIQYTHELVDGEMPTLKECLMKGGTHEPVWPRETDLDFGGALEYLRQGLRLSRSGWNGKGQYIYMTNGSNVTYRHLKENKRKMIRNSFDEDDLVEIMPHIDMKNAQNQIIIGWAPTQTDMLSNDWYIVY